MQPDGQATTNVENHAVPTGDAVQDCLREKNLSWESLHSSHAVERVRFEIVFAEALPKKVVDGIGRASDAKLRDLRFGARQERHVTNFVIGGPLPGGAQLPTQTHTGWQAVRERAPGQIVEAISLDGASMIYESTEYRGWEKAFGRFKNLTKDILSEAAKVVNAAAIIHDYTDRFVFQGDAEKAAPVELLSEAVLAGLPESVLSGGELWHVHRGWFELGNGTKYLINQNFDAQQGKSPSQKDVRSLQIYTKAEQRADGTEVDISDLDANFNHMHLRCNAIVAAALSREMATRVGLSSGGSVFA